MISRSFEQRERTVSRASDANKRYKTRYTRTQHRPASRHVNDHGRVSGTHTPPNHGTLGTIRRGVQGVTVVPHLSSSGRLSQLGAGLLHHPCENRQAWR